MTSEDAKISFARSSLGVKIPALVRGLSAQNQCDENLASKLETLGYDNAYCQLLRAFTALHMHCNDQMDTTIPLYIQVELQFHCTTLKRMTTMNLPRKKAMWINRQTAEEKEERRGEEWGKGLWDLTKPDFYQEVACADSH